jgi:hypothetical protein
MIDPSLAQRRLTTLGIYGLAWAHHDDEDAETVQSLVARCWSDTGTYVNPFVDPVIGVEGLTQLILDYQVLFPDGTVRPIGQPMLHHDYACWRWTLSSSAPIRIRGTNFGRAVTRNCQDLWMKIIRRRSSWSAPGLRRPRTFRERVA